MRHDRPNTVNTILSLIDQNSVIDTCLLLLFSHIDAYHLFYLLVFLLQYYGATILSLIVFAWLGSTVNNLLLLYITGNELLHQMNNRLPHVCDAAARAKFVSVNTALLTPGLKHKGRARSAVKCAYDHLIRRHLS